MPCESGSIVPMTPADGDNTDDQLLDNFKNHLKSFGSSYELPDDILLRVLISRNRDLDKASALLKHYVSAKKNHPELFVPPSTIEESDLRRVGCVLPNTIRTKDGRRCTFSRGTDWDPDFTNLHRMIPALIDFLESTTLDGEYHKDGYVHFVDCSGLSWKHVKAIRPSIVIAAASVMTYKLPINLKKIVAYNANWMVDVIWKIVKPMLPTDLVKLIRIINANNGDKLLKYLPEEIVESQSFIPTEDQWNDQVKYLNDNRDKVASLWDVVFNEETA